MAASRPHAEFDALAAASVSEGVFKDQGLRQGVKRSDAYKSWKTQQSLDDEAVGERKKIRSTRQVFESLGHAGGKGDAKVWCKHAQHCVL